jgi:hypothetical protein
LHNHLNAIQRQMTNHMRQIDQLKQICLFNQNLLRKPVSVPVVRPITAPVAITQPQTYNRPVHSWNENEWPPEENYSEERY